MPNYNNYTVPETPLLPTDAKNAIKATQWGIDTLFHGYIIQSEQISWELVTDQTQDQKGRVVSELDYDKHWTYTFEVIGEGDNSLPAIGDVIQLTPVSVSADLPANPYWKVKSKEYNGSYNDKKKYSYTLERWINFPTQTGN